MADEVGTIEDMEHLEAIRDNLRRQLSQIAVEMTGLKFAMKRIQEPKKPMTALELVKKLRTEELCFTEDWILGSNPVRSFQFSDGAVVNLDEIES